MRATSHSLLSLLLALSSWTCRASDPLSGSYALVAIDAQDLPATVPNTEFQVTDGSLNLSDGSFVFTYGAHPSRTVWRSFTTVLRGTYDSRDASAIEFESSEQTFNGNPVEADHSFVGAVQGENLTLTDPNQVGWTFRRINPM
ncbi:MAG: hypothetical protein JSW51_01965 [Gemmatimonadota bacterium]|nr:MAG: hypothetical protein JSW51_01965 [Gemmatimonadota bacterium]